MDRRDFLTYIGAGAGALTLPSLSTNASAQGESFLEVLAQHLSAQVPRQGIGGYKWGWNIQVQRTNIFDYVTTVRNEAWPEGNDPSRNLTTVFWIGDPGQISENNELKWFRVPSLSHLVQDPNDHNAIRVYVKDDPSLYIDNIAGPKGKAIQYRNGLLEQVRPYLFGSGGLFADHQMFHSFLRSWSDPHSITTIGAVDQNGRGEFTYEIVLYKHFDEHERVPMLASHFDMNDGRQAIWKRDNGRSQVGSPYYSKLALQNGPKEAGIDTTTNDYARESRPWLPDFGR